MYQQSDLLSGRHRASVLRLYRAVDHDDVTALLDVFADGATYYRPGYAPIRGRAELEQFYRNDRIIASGVHRVTAMVCTDDGAGVHGEFEGTLRDGTRAALRFADFFVFDDSGRVAERRTFFYTPCV